MLAGCTGIRAIKHLGTWCYWKIMNLRTVTVSLLHHQPIIGHFPIKAQPQASGKSPDSVLMDQRFSFIYLFELYVECTLDCL